MVSSNKIHESAINFLPDKQSYDIYSSIYLYSNINKDRKELVSSRRILTRRNRSIEQQIADNLATIKDTNKLVSWCLAHIDFLQFLLCKLHK